MEPLKYAKLFIRYIDLFTDLDVIAVTDHNTGKDLDYLITEAANSERKITILPGVEVASNQGIHILCIFDPTKKNRATWNDYIDHFLTEIGLTNGYFDNAGRPLNASLSAQEILDKVCDKGGLCIFAHIGTENGLFYRNSPTANGGTAHIDIYKHKNCQIVQIPSVASLSIGNKNIVDGGNVNYGKKAVTQIKCSDSRKLSDIGKHFTWIKGDPTFEALKQIIFEPTDRVRLQDKKPDTKSTYQVIESVKIVDPQGRFNNQLIPLNRNLVSIIGGKSTGKSLLLYHIAKAADKEEVQRRKKEKQKDQTVPYGNFNDIDLEIKWADGEVT